MRIDKDIRINKYQSNVSTSFMHDFVFTSVIYIFFLMVHCVCFPISHSTLHNNFPLLNKIHTGSFHKNLHFTYQPWLKEQTPILWDVCKIRITANVLPLSGKYTEKLTIAVWVSIGFESSCLTCFLCAVLDVGCSWTSFSSSSRSSTSPNSRSPTFTDACLVWNLPNT